MQQTHPPSPVDAREPGTDRLVIDALFSDYPFPGFLDPIRQRAAEFERAHPRYRVTVRGCGYEEIPAEVSRLALAGTPPTVATYYSGASRQARDTVTRAGTPLFTSIERAVDGRSHILGERVMLDDLTAPARGFFTYQGDLTSLPLSASTMLFYVNTTLLRAAGVWDVPRTWREVELACARVAALRPGVRGVTWPNDGKLVQQWLSQQGAPLLDRDNGRAGRATTVNLTSEPMLALADWWAGLQRRGYFSYSGVLEDWPGNAAEFVGQRVAMRVGSSFEADFMRAAGQREGFDVAVAELPHRDGVAPVGNWIGGDSVWLADGLDPEVRDGALAFLMYLGTPENAARWRAASGSTPVVRSAIDRLEADGWFAGNPHHRVAVDQIARTDGTPGSYSPIIPGSYGVQMAVMEAMDDVLRHGVEPADRLARAEPVAQRALAEYNAIVAAAGPRDPVWLRVGT
ncbi:extracellular solute-binding protein [Micromonospora cathayae]|uniref:Extracellular solute-binding protein n=1 Tax=Micromonospora cathayae TaxID=3028804 RepID=A0ABY7ZKT3_9ACTN|nr:extracellular solute-binding protein [Micromonospora sp. HUAS 3]WDZ83492.1 extracellular solute-binding protein [Micromonospora sp. HUAS 3]